MNFKTKTKNFAKRLGHGDLKSLKYVGPAAIAGEMALATAIVLL